MDVDYNDYRYRCSNYIYISERLFEEDYLNFDPTGDILTLDRYSKVKDDPEKKIYFRFALSLREALQFLLFHEYAHACGMREETARNYAIKSIVELRKAKEGFPYRIDFFPNDFQEELGECTNGSAVDEAFNRTGSAPPNYDVPPSLRIR